MGSRGGNAPNPYRQRHASTLFLRVPSEDWPRVKIGEKTEFRTLRKPGHLTVTKTPTVVVAYAVTGHARYDHRLMVLEERRFEPLFTLSNDAEGVAREGFASYDHFRRYWRARTRRPYRPMEKVWVWRVRPLMSSDIVPMSGLLFERLYGEFL